MYIGHQHKDLYERLVKAQNRNTHIDIITFTAFFTTREELEAHVLRYEDEEK